MRAGVVVFPGTNCEQDAVYALRHLGYDARYIWHGESDLSGYDVVVLPGGFSYGDYLRCGAIARFSPIMAEVVRFAEAGGYVIGICNGFQVLCEAHLLPGALLQNENLKFLCQSVNLRIEDSRCEWLDEPAGTVVQIPISHNEGNYICDADTLARLQQNNQIVLRYCEADGSRREGGSAPNGAMDDIAGICNERGNVFGLMPHPERVTDGVAGSTQGAKFFTTIAQKIAEGAAR